jgi:hypothetical protein
MIFQDFLKYYGDLVSNLMEQIKQFNQVLPWENVLKPSNKKTEVLL